MRKVELEIFTPAERMPETSTATENKIVLIFCRHIVRDDWKWRLGIWLDVLDEWRILNEISPVEVKEWAELPQ